MMNVWEGDMSKALHSEGPNQKYEQEMQLFGQFVGNWDFVSTVYAPDGTKEIVSGEWLFDWVLMGRAIQDVWIIPGRKDRDKPGMPEGEYGTTLRFYDPESQNWKVVWVGPLRNRLKTFVARKVGDEIVLEATNEPDFRMQWIFSDIKAGSFHWRSVISADDGQTWKLNQEMDVVRKPENDEQ